MLPKTHNISMYIKCESRQKGEIAAIYIPITHLPFLSGAWTNDGGGFNNIASFDTLN